MTSRVRAATADDAAEAVRLAAVMFASMGMDVSGERWMADGRQHVRDRLGTDLALFVVDHPSEPGTLVASAAGTIAARLPTPVNPSGLAGYVQWVCTDDGHRGEGLGRAVMASLLAWFDGQGVLAVELHSTAPAERLYASLGFSDEGPRAMRRRSW
jgi:GNAT superfamily N-acetyltransferase